LACLLRFTISLLRPKISGIGKKAMNFTIDILIDIRNGFLKADFRTRSALAVLLASTAGLEPATCGLEIRCSSG
jgi:hypothetical protein